MSRRNIKPDGVVFLVQVQRMMCDGCGKISETNMHWKEGWIEVTGCISVGAKLEEAPVKDRNIQQINARKKRHHFCCWECMKMHNDLNKHENMAERLGGSK